MTDLATAFAAPPKRKPRTPCTFGGWLAEQDRPGALAVQAAVLDRAGWNATQIAETIRESTGADHNPDNIARHRRGLEGKPTGCDCEPLT
jgi:hypothetical protein